MEVKLPPLLHLINGDGRFRSRIYRDPFFLPFQVGQFQKAFEHLGNALTFDPSYEKAILAAGSVIQRHNDFDVALTKYRVAAVKV